MDRWVDAPGRLNRPADDRRKAMFLELATFSPVRDDVRFVLFGELFCRARHDHRPIRVLTGAAKFTSVSILASGATARIFGSSSSHFS